MYVHQPANRNGLHPAGRTRDDGGDAGPCWHTAPRGETAKASFGAFHRVVQQANGTPGSSVILEPIGLVMVDDNGVRVGTPGGCCVLWHSNEPDVMFCHNHATNKMGLKVHAGDLTRTGFEFLDVSANQVSQ